MYIEKIALITTARMLECSKVFQIFGVREWYRCVYTITNTRAGQCKHDRRHAVANKAKRSTRVDKSQRDCRTLPAKAVEAIYKKHLRNFGSTDYGTATIVSTLYTASAITLVYLAKHQLCLLLCPISECRYVVCKKSWFCVLYHTDIIPLFCCS